MWQVRTEASTAQKGNVSKVPKGTLTLFPLEVCGGGGGANKRRFMWASADMGTDHSVRSIVGEGWKEC